MSRAAEKLVLDALAAHDAELAAKVEEALEDVRLAEAYRKLGAALLEFKCKATAHLTLERPQAPKRARKRTGKPAKRSAKAAPTARSRRTKAA